IRNGSLSGQTSSHASTVSMTELTEWTKWFQNKTRAPILIIRFILSSESLARAPSDLNCLTVLLDFRRFVTMPAIVSRLIAFDFTRSPINTVAVENMTRFGISAAFGIMDF